MSLRPRKPGDLTPLDKANLKADALYRAGKLDAQAESHRAHKKALGTIFTCASGDNSDLFPRIMALYVPPGSLVADVTYGKGVFWRRIPEGCYRLTPSDLQTGVDFTRLPYSDGEYDALILDPPYMNGGAGVKESLNKCYKNPGANSYEAVFRLYMKGILEAHRVLRKGGILVVKCQPCVADHVQKPVHSHLIAGLPPLGFRFEDEFVLHADAVPMMRHAEQQHARKNHSYFLVFSKVR